MDIDRPVTVYRVSKATVSLLFFSSTLETKIDIRTLKASIIFFIFESIRSRDSHRSHFPADENGVSLFRFVQTGEIALVVRISCMKRGSFKIKRFPQFLLFSFVKNPECSTNVDKYPRENSVAKGITVSSGKNREVDGFRGRLPGKLDAVSLVTGPGTGQRRSGATRR